MAAEARIEDNREEQRYEIWVDGSRAGMAVYRLAPGMITFVHTEIDPAHEGEGLGAQLVRAALDDARARGLAVRPVCPFVARFIRRHPDYGDLVAPTRP
jgi:uncharacterized protein